MLAFRLEVDGAYVGPNEGVPALGRGLLSVAVAAGGGGGQWTGRGWRGAKEAEPRWIGGCGSKALSSEVEGERAVEWSRGGEKKRR